MRQRKKSRYLLVIFGGCFGTLILVFVSGYLFITGPVTRFLDALDDKPHQPTAIEKAIDADDAALVEKLLNNGVNPNARCSSCGRTPLTYARNPKSIKVVESLIKHGADVNGGDDSGNRPLAGAAYDGNVELLNLLLSHGADVRAKIDDGNTALHEAIFNSMSPSDMKTKCKIINILLDHGAPIDEPNNRNETPLYNATDLGFEEAFDILVARGANQTRKFWQGNTLLHAAAMSDNPHLVEKLLKSGMDINARDDANMTPLHAAVYWGMDAIDDNPRMVTLLIKNGADINAKDHEGKTARAHAIQLSRNQVAAALSAH